MKCKTATPVGSAKSENPLLRRFSEEELVEEEPHGKRPSEMEIIKNIRKSTYNDDL
ncbi:hypothetical protein [Salipaludibacillus neizhouensis]|uniref:hypothetical protein n=1 Tax=Salipaludibacillus neizhouensis TaxID=885475 RepID=UPI001600C172|nr:hypothetical protein [Salipaludibacillus neizhouensis]